MNDKSTIPALEGVWCGDGGEIVELFPLDGMRQDRQASTLRIRQVNLFPLELRFQEAILLAEIPDNVILVSIDPTGQPRDQELENHGPPRVEHTNAISRFSIRST